MSAEDEGSRVALELRLREMLDDDDAVGAVGEMLDAGWRPPDEVARLEARLAEAERARDEAGAGLAKCNEKLRGHQASIERRKHNAAEQEARLARLEGSLRDVIYGLRNQPELTREHIAQAAEGTLAASEEGAE